LGCPRFFEFHPDATIEDYCERFGCSYEQAVKEIKSFGLDPKRYESPQNVPGRDFHGMESSLVLDNEPSKFSNTTSMNEYMNSDGIDRGYVKTTGEGFTLYLLNNIKSYSLMKRLYYENPSKKEEEIVSVIELLYQLYLNKHDPKASQEKEIKGAIEDIISKESEDDEEERKRRLKRILTGLKKIISDKTTELQKEEIELKFDGSNDTNDLVMSLYEFWLLISSSLHLLVTRMNKH